MDRQLVGYLKSAAYAEDKSDPHDINYPRIQQICEQLAMWAKQATQGTYLPSLEEMDRICQFGEVLKKELDHVRSDLTRRKNLELLLPSPNTQHHLPCSSLLSPTSPTPSSPTAQHSMAMSTNANSGTLVSQSTSNGSSSPHGLNSMNGDSSSMSITSTGVMQSDEYWKTRKMDPTKINTRRSPTPLYVNLTEQMILAQSSKRKRPAEGDLYCHNCKTKDTPEWRRGPMGAKTLCNACGIRWRLSQAEAAKQKKGEQLSPPQTPQLQYPQHLHQLQQQQPQQSHQQQSQLSVQQSLLQQQQQLRQQQLQQLHQQQQQMQQLQQQYSQSHAHHPHPQQQHMIMPGHVGLAQENIPNSNRMSISGETSRMSLSGETGSSSRSTSTGSVISSLSMTPSPIAT